MMNKTKTGTTVSNYLTEINAWMDMITYDSYDSLDGYGYDGLDYI